MYAVRASLPCRASPGPATPRLGAAGLAMSVRFRDSNPACMPSPLFRALPSQALPCLALPRRASPSHGVLTETASAVVRADDSNVGVCQPRFPCLAVA
jgi:hypothetical protein